MTTDLIKTLEGLEKKVCWNNMERQFYRCSLPQIISALKDAERMREALVEIKDMTPGYEDNSGDYSIHLIALEGLATADTKESEK